MPPVPSAPARRQPSPAPALAVFGEFFFDLVFYHLPDTPRLGEEVKTESYFEAPGGGVATTALAARKLGTPTAIITRVGPDALHRPTWRSLTRTGLDLSACEVRPRASTALTACITFDHDRMMVTHDAINRDLEAMLSKPRVRSLLRRVRHAHFACPPRNAQLWGEVLDDLASRGITLSADIGWNPDLKPAHLKKILRRCDFLFPNDREALALTGASDVEQALARLQTWVRYPVIKLGASGSVMAAGGKIVRAPALPVRLVDATGAGDAFNGGFLHAFLNGCDWQGCLLAGNVCGGLATTAPGGSAALPSRRLFLQTLKAAAPAGAVLPRSPRRS